MRIFLIICILAISKHAYSKVGVRPFVSGVRIENDVNSPGFIGYSEAGEILVEADVTVDVVIFGHGLEDVEYVSFTDSVCLTSEFNISSSEFFIHKDMRIVFKHKFLEWEKPWRICLKSETYDFIQIDDDRTWIQTAAATHETYFPPLIQISIMCVLFFLSSLCSGLNLGLMSLSPQELKILMKCGSRREAKYAAAIYPVRMKGNQLLSTLIIVNVIVNAGIAILFDDLTEGLIAFISSSAGIVILGEILPQSLCVKYGLAIGANTISLTKLFMFLTSPITYPLGKLLDLYAGTDTDSVDRTRIVEMLKMNIEQGECDIDLETLKIAVGAMELRKKTAKDVMTKLDDVFMLSEDQILNAETMTKISDSGYSRIPVYEANNMNKVKYLLYVSDLALIGKDNNITAKAVAGFNKRRLRIVDENMPLIALMEEFKLGDYHLAMVAKSNELETRKKPNRFVERQIDTFIMKGLQVVEATAELLPPIDPDNEVSVTLVGLVTLEDITEELLQCEITDETDWDVSDERQRKQRAHMSKKRIAELFCSEKKSERLSLHMLEMTQRWLLEKSPIFENNMMDPKAFENLIQRNIRDVLIVPPKNSTAPSTVTLYENGVMSKRFVLLLEGKATVIFKNKKLKFEVGPWTCFGEPVLTSVEQCLMENKEPSSSFFMPDYDLIVSKNCRFLQISVTSLIHSLRITQVVRDLRSPKISITSDDDYVPELRKISIKENEIATRKRSSSSIMSSLAIPPVRLVSKIASVEEINPMLSTSYED